MTSSDIAQATVKLDACILEIEQVATDLRSEVSSRIQDVLARVEEIREEYLREEER